MTVPPQDIRVRLAAFEWLQSQVDATRSLPCLILTQEV
jgi:hypothetical protein